MRRDLIVAFLLATLTFGLYWPVRNHDFIFYDDPQFITENPQIQAGLRWATFEYAFTHAVVGNWHPLTTLSHALDCQLFGVTAGAHHLVNAMFHAANAALLFLLLRLLIGGNWTPLAANRRTVNRSSTAVAWVDTIGPSALITALFAWHPLRVESVAWVAERKDVLSGFFFFLCLWSYIVFVKRKNGDQRHVRPTNAWWFYVGALLSFALGLMSKPMLVTLPFVLLLLDYWPLRRFGAADQKEKAALLVTLIVEKAPFFLFSIIDCAITLAVQGNAGAMQTIAGLTFSDRLANAIAATWRYLGKFFWPAKLAIVYPHPAQHYFLSDSWPGWEIGLAATALVLVTVLFVRLRHTAAYLTMGWLWFLGMLVPVCGLIQVGEQAMADRYTYLPLIGPAIALVWWLTEPSSFVARRNTIRLPHTAVIVIIVCWTGVLMGLTRHQLSFWKDTVALFGHAVEVTADNPSAQFALGVGLENHGDMPNAMVHYRVAVAIDPRYRKAYYNMGQILRKTGEFKAAAKAYSSALRLNPTDVPTLLNLASVLARLGQTQEAIAHLDQALRLDPDSIEGLNNLAWLLSTSADASNRNGLRAVQLAEHACALTQNEQPVLLGTLAAAYAENGRFTEAIETAQKASARATELGDSVTATKNKEFIELYRTKSAYREKLDAGMGKL